MKNNTSLFEMMRIDENLIIIKCIVGCFFINNHGAQVPDPDFQKITPREIPLWQKYDFLGKKHINPKPLRTKVQQIIERILLL